jgi:hypothetical protein
MDWNLAVTEWKPFRHEVRAQWRNLTNAQLDGIAGLRSVLAEQIRVCYGITSEDAEHQIRSFEARNEFFRPVSSR